MYNSTYFHAIKPELANVGVAGTGDGPVLVTWDDPRSAQSYYARSADSGRTWSEPQLIETGSGPATLARVATTPNGDFLQLWRDVTASGCGLIGRRSKDGGTTWEAPERVLSGLGRCPDVWTFVPGANDQLWLVGTAAATNPGANTGSATIAQWDGTHWLGPYDVNLTFYDAASKSTVKLNCLNLALSGTAAGITGCDAGGDIWAARNAVDLNQLLPAVQPPWSGVEKLSSSDASLGESLPALVADQAGNMIAVWSQATSANDLSTDLYAATQTRDRWSQPTQILSSPASGLSTGSASVNRAEQPVMLIDAQDRLHLVWSGGTDNAIFSSWAYRRDAASLTGWSVPVVIASSASLNSSPTIAQDKGSGTLYLAYAVPYNEDRGIYLAQSTDNGVTWSTPHRVFDAAGALWNSVDKPQLAYQPNAKTLHLVWLRATPPGGTDAQAIYYARSTDDGQTWTEPVKIAEGLVDWPRITVTGSGITHIVWNQLPSKDDGSPAPMSIWAQASDDVGRTWTSPQIVRGFEQVSGPAALISGGGTKAYLTALGMGANTESTLLYSESNDKTWQAVSSFGLGQPATRGNGLDAAFAPVAGRLGALLRERVWQTDGTSRPAIGVTIRTIAPEQIIAVLIATPAATATPQPSPTPPPTATPRPLLDSDLQQPQTQSTGLPPIAIGAILAGILVVAAGGDHQRASTPLIFGESNGRESMTSTLVTGGAGFIGSHLVEALLKRGQQVRVLDNFSSGRAANLAHLSGVDVITGDVRDEALVNSLVREVDYVLHLAAVVSVPQSMADPALTNAVNIEGTLNLLNAARQFGLKRLVLSSSCAVYGDNDDLPLNETSQTKPLSPYAATKLMGEIYCQTYQRAYGVPTVCLRYFNIYGPRQDPNGRVRRRDP